MLSGFPSVEDVADALMKSNRHNTICYADPLYRRRGDEGLLHLEIVIATETHCYWYLMVGDLDKNEFYKKMKRGQHYVTEYIEPGSSEEEVRAAAARMVEALRQKTFGDGNSSNSDDHVEQGNSNGEIG